MHDEPHNDLERQAIAAWTAQEPPPGFADRVQAAVHRGRRRRGEPCEQPRGQPFHLSAEASEHHEARSRRRRAIDRRQRDECRLEDLARARAERRPQPRDRLAPRIRVEAARKHRSEAHQLAHGVQARRGVMLMPREPLEAISEVEAGQSPRS